LWILIAAGAVIALVAGLCGFVAAMRFNPGFNQRVRSSALFVPITRSNNNFLRSSLALPALGQDYEELIKTEENHRGPLSF
jgi:hypothetical protein